MSLFLPPSYLSGFSSLTHVPLRLHTTGWRCTSTLFSVVDVSVITFLVMYTGLSSHSALSLLISMSQDTHRHCDDGHLYLWVDRCSGVLLSELVQRYDWIIWLSDLCGLLFSEINLQNLQRSFLTSS